jgi:hypothetical protein
MRWLFYLIPSIFFMTCFMALDGARELPIARLEEEAGCISARMNSVSDNMSRLVQGVNLGRIEYHDIENQIVGTDRQMAKLKGELGLVWRELDRLEVVAAGDEVIRRTMGISGVLCGIAGLAIVAKRHGEHSSQCLLASAILLAAMAI